MTQVQLRSKLHQFIDSADEKKLHAIYKIVNNEMENKSLMSDEQKAELDFRLNEYIKGKGKNYTLNTALKRIRSKRKIAE